MPATDVQFLGDSLVTFMGSDVQFLGPAETACAEKVKVPMVMAGASTLGMFGLGLFGVYKSFKGHWAAGITGLVAAGATYVIGAAVAGSAARTYQNCLAANTGPAEQPKLPGAAP